MRFMPVILVVLVVGVITVFASEDKSTSEPNNDLFVLGVAAFKAGDYELAAREFEMLVQQNTSWAAGYVTLGQCYYMLHQPKLGDETIRRAKELDDTTDQFKAYFDAGMKLRNINSFDQAIAPLERAVEFASGSRKNTALMQLASSYLMADQDDKARKAFERHQQEFGVDTRNTYHLALACQKLSEYPCALQNLRRSFQLHSASEPHLQTCQYLAEWSRYWALHPDNNGRRSELLGQAVKDTKVWFDAEPNSPAAQDSYAETLLAAGRARDVLAQFLPVAERDARNCIARTALAKAYNWLGQGADAERWALEAKRCDPSDAKAHVELAASYMHQIGQENSSLTEVRGNLVRMREVVNLLQRALQLEPGHARAAALLADAQDTLVLLTEVESDFVASDDDYDNDVKRAAALEIRQRCLSIYWKMRSESLEISMEEETFFREHQCRQYAPK